VTARVRLTPWRVRNSGSIQASWAALRGKPPFASGAIVPVLPFLFLSGQSGGVGSVLCRALGLFVIGITLFTGRSVFYSGARQVMFGLSAAVITYGIGRLIGVRLSG